MPVISSQASPANSLGATAHRAPAAVAGLPPPPTRRPCLSHSPPGAHVRVWFSQRFTSFFSPFRSQVSHGARPVAWTRTRFLPSRMQLQRGHAGVCAGPHGVTAVCWHCGLCGSIAAAVASWHVVSWGCLHSSGREAASTLELPLTLTFDRARKTHRHTATAFYSLRL